MPPPRSPSAAGRQQSVGCTSALDDAARQFCIADSFVLTSPRSASSVIERCTCSHNRPITAHEQSRELDPDALEPHVFPMATLIHPALIFLKPDRNRDSLRSSHRGGTDHGEVEGPEARDGVSGSSASPVTVRRRPLAHLLLFSLACPLSCLCLFLKICKLLAARGLYAG